jgi:hypothetical protein
MVAVLVPEAAAPLVILSWPIAVARADQIQSAATLVEVRQDLLELGPQHMSEATA